MGNETHFTPAQRFILEQASDAELYQAISHTRSRQGTHIVLAGSVWNWGDWGNWLRRDIIAPAEDLLEEQRQQIHQLVCVDWEACAKLPGLANRLDAVSQIAEVLLLFVSGLVGKLVARAVAIAVAYVLTERGLHAFCECKA